MNHPFAMRAWRLFVPLLGALAVHGAAQAGAGNLVTTVVRLQDTVTYSDPTAKLPLATFVGYRVTIANAGGNTINNIRFTGAAAVTQAGESAPVASVDGATCALSGSAVDCTVGQLKAGESFPTFAVFFKAPARLAGSTLPNGVDGACTTTDCVNFSGTTFYAEGTGGITSPPDNSIAEWGPVSVPLGTTTPVFVRSSVQKAGGTLYTGTGALTTSADPLSTTVVVPAGTTYTTAQILESSTTTQCNSVLTTCFTSDITVPGTFRPYLQVVLRLDALAVPNGTKIGSILVSYEGTVIGDCASPTTVTGTGIPCIASKKTYPKNSKNGRDFPIELEGDFEWTLINTQNGSVKIF